MASAGTAENVVPAETRVRVDVRIEEPAEQHRLDLAMAELAAAGTSVPGATVEILGGINRPPMHASASASLFPVAERAAAGRGHRRHPRRGRGRRQ